MLIFGVGAVAYFASLSKGGSHLEVRAIDSSSGDGLEGVTVKVNGHTKTTGSEGWASFALSKGKYTITLQKEGYKSKQYSVSAPENVTVGLLRETEGPSA